MTAEAFKWSEAKILKDWDIADDLAVLCHTFDDQQGLTDELVRTVGTFGLLISTSKTRFMNVNVGEETLKLNRGDLGNVEESTYYLRIKVSADDKITREVRTRIAKATVACSSLNNI